MAAAQRPDVPVQCTIPDTKLILAAALAEGVTQEATTAALEEGVALEAAPAVDVLGVRKEGGLWLPPPTPCYAGHVGKRRRVLSKDHPNFCD